MRFLTRDAETAPARRSWHAPFRLFRPRISERPSRSVDPEKRGEQHLKTDHKRSHDNEASHAKTRNLFGERTIAVERINLIVRGNRKRGRKKTKETLHGNGNAAVMDGRDGRLRGRGTTGSRAGQRDVLIAGSRLATSLVESHSENVCVCVSVCVHRTRPRTGVSFSCRLAAAGCWRGKVATCQSNVQLCVGSQSAHRPQSIGPVFAFLFRSTRGTFFGARRRLHHDGANKGPSGSPWSAGGHRSENKNNQQSERAKKKKQQHDNTET